MASSLTTIILSSALLLLLLLSVAAMAADTSETLDMLSREKEKTTRLRFFMHDIISGRTATSIKIVSGPSNTSALLNYGDTYVFDDALTEGPNATSLPVGRAQGIYARASHGGLDLLLTMNLVFTAGKFNGSTLAVVARDAILDAMRELPVVGGTGRFRLARGFALMKTNWFNMTSGDAVLDFDVHVLHH